MKEMSEKKTEVMPNDWKKKFNIEDELPKQENESWYQYQLRLNLSIPRQLLTQFTNKVLLQLKVNDELMKKFPKLPKAVDESLVKCSDVMDSKMNYCSSLCRSHGSLIILGSCLLVGLPSLKLSKHIFRMNVMTAFAATSSLVFLSNYKSMRGDKAEEL
jgi:hypothetical protein